MKSKIFSVGINSNWDLAEIKTFLIKYQNYLHSIFFAIPVPISGDTRDSFTCRPVLDKNKNALNKLAIIADFAKQLDIRVDLIANKVPHLNVEDNYINLYSAINLIKPSEMTVLPEIAKKIYEECSIEIPFVYSFNSNSPTAKDFEDPLFYSYAIARHFLWQPKLWPKNKEIRFLVNSGCPSCKGCGDFTWDRNCEALFKSEVEKHNINYYIASHILYPQDIKLYLSEFKDYNFVFKIGSRNDESLAFVIKFLNFYIKNIDNLCCINELINYDYTLLINQIKDKNNNEILNYKQQLWETLIPGIKY